MQLIVRSKPNLIENHFIPEPTRSLLWATDEDITKIRTPGSISINIDISNHKIEVDGNKGLHEEPSMIWTKLPVKKTGIKETSKMYHPAYSTLTPEQRFEYLTWLKGITTETNLSYVFLYYYGLERHLLLGDYDNAVEEIIKLLKNHDKGSFRGYATAALIASSSYRKRLDILDRAPELLTGLTKESLYLRYLSNKPLSGVEVTDLSSKVGFTNKRYIKKYPNLFIEILDARIKDITIEMGFWDSLSIKSLPVVESILFANVSIPSNIRTFKIPDVLQGEEFRKTLYRLLTFTHNKIKEIKAKS